MTIHPKHMEWIEARGLDPELAERFGLQTVQRDGRNWLAVPYLEAGEPINHKYRLTSQKDHRMDTGAPLALWNADCLQDPKVKSGQTPVVITEGEWDALAAIQAGFLYAVSVPNGAPGTPTSDLDNAKRYDWVDRHADALAGVKEFIIAVDDDEAGRYLRTDLVALLGAERCRFVEYPFPSKDLNEVLLDHGAQRLVDCISTAKPFPVQGLFSLDDFPERGEIRHYGVGIPAIADMISIVPGTLTVVTGFANAGKSLLLNSIIAHTLNNHFPVCVASFETDVKPILRDGLLGCLLKCGKHDIRHRDSTAAMELLRDRLMIISQAVDEDDEMDLDRFLDLARVAVVRHGCRMVVLDPWNEVEHKTRHGETETDYTGRALRAVKRFARQYDVAFWIVAHPAKQLEGTKKPPSLYSVSGSANWANKPEYGLTYHRSSFDANEAEIIVQKVRMGLPGRRGSKRVTYDFRTSEFREIGGATETAPVPSTP